MNILAFLSTQSGGVGGNLAALLPLVIMLLILYLFMIRPQQKKNKEDAQMRSSIEVGDEIVTIGGIIGIVVSIKDDTMVIETGSDRSKMRIYRWAVQSNETAKEAAAEAKKNK